MGHSVIDRFLDRCATNPNQRLFTWLDEEKKARLQLSFQETRLRAEAIARHLQKNGLRAGDRVVLAYSPSLDFVTAFLGCLLARILPVSVSPPHPSHLVRDLDRLNDIIENSGAKAILTNQEYLRLKQLSQARDFVKKLVSSRKQPLWPRLSWIATDTISPDSSATFTFVSPKDDELVFLQYTSGSTSAPRGVMISSENFRHQVEHLVRIQKRVPQPLFFSWLPHYHDLGLLITLGHLWGEGELYLMSPLTFIERPAIWFEVISELKATHTSGPNFAYELGVRKTTPLQRQDWDLSSLVFAGCGGEPVRYDTMQDFNRAFGPTGFRPEAFCPSYGLAEHTLVVASGGDATLHLDSHALESEGTIKEVPIDGLENIPNDKLKTIKTKSIVTAGRVFDDVEVRIVDPDTHLLCAPDQIGEIWITSKSKAVGYYGNEEKTQETFRAKIKNSNDPNEYLRTGDLGCFRDGFIFITGRLKDLIIIRGRNIYPQDIELSVRSCHSLIRPGGVVAFSVDHQKLSESSPGSTIEERLVVLAEVKVPGTNSRTGSKKLLEKNQPDFEAEIQSVIQSIMGQVSENHQVTCHSIVIGLPGMLLKTTSGKPQRNACKRAFLRGELTQSKQFLKVATFENSQENIHEKKSPSAPESAGLQSIQLLLRNEVISILGSELMPPDFENVPLSGIGLDSLNKVELKTRLARNFEDLFGFSLQFKVFLNDPTLTELAKLLHDEVRQFREKPNTREVPEQQSSSKQGASSDRSPTHAETSLVQDLYSAAGPSLLKRIEPFTKMLEKQPKAGMPLCRQLMGPCDHRTKIWDVAAQSEKAMIMMASNNYLGLADHPRIKERVKKAIDEFGVGVGGPPLLAGMTRLHRELEVSLAQLKGAEDAMLFGSGYQASLGVISGLVRDDDIFIYDEYSHASTFDAIKLARSTAKFQTYSFRHNDVEHLQDLLLVARHRQKNRPGQIFVSVEGVYSMDGDLAPLAEIRKLCDDFQAMLMVDDAHGTCVMGETGRGTAEHFQIEGQVDISIGTFSKAFMVTGGFIAAKREVIEYLRFFARSYMFSAHLPPPTVAAVLGVLDILKSEPERIKKVHSNARYFTNGLNQLGYRVVTQSGIVPVILPPAFDVHEVSRRFHDAGIFLSSVTPPVVPVGKERLRLSMMANHTQEDLDFVLSAFEDLGAGMGRLERVEGVRSELDLNRV